LEPGTEKRITTTTSITTNPVAIALESMPVLLALGCKSTTLWVVELTLTEALTLVDEFEAWGGAESGCVFTSAAGFAAKIRGCTFLIENNTGTPIFSTDVDLIFEWVGTAIDRFLSIPPTLGFPVQGFTLLRLSNVSTLTRSIL
jgi:hypothetical protein